jgi:hypothetical protein
MLSVRVSVQRTGMPRFFASQTMSASSAPKAAFAPKPPPTSGAMIRSSCGSSPSVGQRPWWSRCGTCVESQAVILPFDGSAAAERTSSGHAAMRWLTSVSDTTTSQFSNSVGS